MKSLYKKIFVIFIVVIAIFLIINLNKEQPKDATIKPLTNETQNIEKTEEISKEINFEDYNYQFVDQEVKTLLKDKIGSNKILFNLPSTDYVNISKGKVFGIAFAINNPNPSGENYFEYSFTPDSQTLTNCNVDYKTAISWIISGQKSFGKIFEGWIDTMSVSFLFPEKAQNCQAIYNFHITKDSETYATKKLIINIVG